MASAALSGCGDAGYLSLPAYRSPLCRLGLLVGLSVPHLAPERDPLELRLLRRLLLSPIRGQGHAGTSGARHCDRRPDLPVRVHRHPLDRHRDRARVRERHARRLPAEERLGRGDASGDQLLHLSADRQPEIRDQTAASPGVAVLLHRPGPLGNLAGHRHDRDCGRRHTLVPTELAPACRGPLLTDHDVLRRCRTGHLRYRPVAWLFQPRCVPHGSVAFVGSLPGCSHATAVAGIWVFRFLEPGFDRGPGNLGGDRLAGPVGP